MTKLRVTLTLITIMVMLTFGTLFGLYAKGYRFDKDLLKFIPHGILVVESEPKAAQVYIDGEFETATDATIRLAPGTYDISVQKEGFITWNKRVTIEVEEVTEADIQLFRSTPSLTAITFSGVISPVATGDYTKIAYSIEVDKTETEKAGLWVMETVNLPLGFAKDPKRITDGNLTNASWEWSPNGQEILLTTPLGIYLLDAGTFTPQNQRVNVLSQKEEILASWETEKLRKLNAKVRNMPNTLQDLFLNRVESISFSPDEKKVLYTASSSAIIPENLIKPIPGASTQKQERDIKVGHTYVYDIKEDQNFLLSTGSKEERIAWFPSSNHLVVAKKDKVYISDLDGTNNQTVFAGAYSIPNAFPTLNKDRLFVLTNLGAFGEIPNLYSISLK